MTVTSIIEELRKLKITVKAKNDELVLTGDKNKLTPQLIESIKRNKSALLNIIKNYVKEADINFIPNKGAEQYFPLTAQQKSIWLATQNPITAVLYNQPSMFVAEGELNIEAFKYAVRAIVQEHESMQTAFVEIDGSPVQTVIKGADIIVDFIEKANNNNIDEIYKKFSAYIFDLSKPPLLQCTIVKETEHKHYLLFNIHHIVSDGWSVNIFFNELLNNYSSILKGENKENKLYGQKTSFREFAEYQNNYVNSSSGKADFNFWKNKIGNYFSPTKLYSKTDYKGLDYYYGDYLNNYLPASLTGKIVNYCKSKKITPFVFYSAVLTLLLKKYTANDEISFGTPFACRNEAKYNDVIGCFINTLPIVVNIDENSSFDKLLTTASNEIAEVFKHQNYPAEKIVDELKLHNNGNGSPLFDIIIVYQNYSLTSYELENLKISYIETPVEKCKSGLVIRLFEEGDRLLINIEYSRKLFDRYFIEQMFGHLKIILQTIIKNPHVTNNEISLLQQSEKHSLIKLLNNTKIGFAKNKTVLDHLNEQFINQKDKTAVTINSKNMSYADLDKKSNRLANYLITEIKIRPGDIVGIMTGRNENLIIGIVAALKAGAAYLPVNPNYPETRKQLMLDDSGCRIILTDEVYKSGRIEYLSVDKISADEKYDSEINYAAQISQNDPAYIIYTSGSTGKPKGVIVTHKNLFRLFFNKDQKFDFNENDVWTLFHSYSFDFSVWEIFGALLFGGRLVIVPDQIVKDPAAFYELLLHEKVSVLNQTPSAFYRLDPCNTNKLSIRYVIFGGESFQPGKIKEWKKNYPGTKFINMYGITETTVHVTYKEISSEDVEKGISNIGRPIPTLGVCVLNEKLDLLPKGIAGQICVYGDGVSLGYLNRPELTSERFKNIFPLGLCYLSGDLGRVLENGDIEYLGRMDNQVQLHGFRIELSEIENALVQIDGVKEVVALNTGGNENIRISAFYTGDTKYQNDTLREELSEILPGYMLPSNFVFVEAIPLTPNGKIDKQALMKIQSSNNKRLIQPVNETEEKILKAWKATLVEDSISTDESFFAIGGDSIKALKLVYEINKIADTGITIADLYKNDTIKKLAAKMETASPVISINEIKKELARIENKSNELIRKNNLAGSVEKIFPMSDIQRGMIYYSIKSSDSSIYHDQFVYQAIIKNFSLDTFRKVIELLIKKHPMLRTAFNMYDYDEDVQVVYQNVEATLEYEDLHALNISAVEKIVNKYISEERTQKFDIKNPPLWRMKIFIAENDVIVFCWSFHHALMDGWSNASFFTEVLKTYGELQKDEKHKPDAIGSSYIHYIAEQNVVKKNKDIIDFWRNELADYKRLELPKSEIVEDKNEVSEYFVKFGSELLIEMKKLADDLNTDLKTLFFSAYIYCMSLLTHENDLLVGIVTNNRPVTEDSEKILGCFLNTVPFRISITDEQTWEELIHSVSAKMNELKKYDTLSLFEIIKNIEANADDENPLFDTVFNYIDFNIYENVYNDFSLANHGIDEYEFDGYENTNTPLNFTVSNTLNNPLLKISYNPGRISSKWIERLGGYYKNILNSIATGRDEVIDNNKILSGTDKKFLNKINDTQKKYDLYKTYNEKFEQNLPLFSNNIAIVSEDKKVTYKELNDKAEKLAAIIEEKQRNKNEIIALITEPSEDLYTGMLSILKAGCAVMPVSTKTPKERILVMLKDSDACIVLASKSSLNSVGIKQSELESLGITLINLDEIDFTNIKLNSRGKNKKTSSKDAAYIVYTSGTTGKPKGIVFEHSSILNLCNWYNEYYSITEKDRSTKYADINYDANIWEIFPAFLKGVTIYTIPEELKLDMPRLNQFYERNKITVSWLPTPILEQFIYEDNNSLRVLTTGGDRLKNYTGKQYNIFNNYGPAENTVCASAYEVKTIEENIPIGKPIANNKIYILKRNSLQILPPGVAGEICVAGSSLSRGYLNDPNLTTEKFVHTSNGERIYRTGDLGRYDEKGNIEFLGRIDRQIKIRGQRLEVEEIESVLLKHPGVKEAVVTADKGRDSSNIGLKAFIAADRLKVNEDQLEEYLSRQLPSFMIPSQINILDKIPLTVSGKIDYKTLSTISVKRGKNSNKFDDEIEQKLAAIWAEVLNREVENIDNNKNFFEQGGNSLFLIRIQKKINQTFGIDIPITGLLKNTTLFKLAKHIKKFQGGEEYETLNIIKETANNSLKEITDDVAVIGLACKFPGADNIDEFWNNLVNGVESISFFSDDELKQAGIPHQVINSQSYVKAAGIISDPESFDPAFFNYTDNEARVMDPQIRLFHQCVWSALENGGYNPESYEGRIGLFAGASKNNHWENQQLTIEGVDTLSSSLLSSKDNLATLISYKLNLKGPAVNLFTACSTSLVAVHEACKSIKAGECEMALCGGVNLSLPFIGGSQSGEGSVFSDDGHCRPFCKEGKGTVAGKGAGVVLLKSLNDAVKDGDNIYAVIKKSAINNDGYQKVGFTAPSIEGQNELLQSIYTKNRIETESIDYIETHGTGTELGDAVEINALQNTFKGVKNKIAIGSVKSNIGHLDTAAGIAAFIKSVLMLNKKTIVQSVHYTSANNKIDFSKSPFYVANKNSKWKKTKGKRRAGISSFGIGGTNAHVVLEEYVQPENMTGAEKDIKIIPLSASTSYSLNEYKKSLKNYLVEKEHNDLTSIAYTLQTTRKEFQYRSALVCDDKNDCIKKLEADSSFNKISSNTKVIFMFPGQGTQYVNMGRKLYESQPEFKLWFDKCNEIINKYSSDTDIRKILYPDEQANDKKEISETLSAHCALFVFEFSLAKLLINWGVKPDYMIGHSLGEYTAACLSGIIGLEDAIKIVLARGRLVKKVSGRMLSVVTEEGKLNQCIAEYNNGTKRVELAAINSDTHFIVSGKEKDIEDFNRHLESQGIEGKVLHIDFASHCSLMNAITDEFNSSLEGISYNKPEIPLVTNLDNRLLKEDMKLSNMYWSEHLLNPVQFAKGLNGLVAGNENSILVEVGPGSTLSTFAKNISLIEGKFNTINLIPHPKEEVEFKRFFYERVALMWSIGIHFDWKAFNGDRKYRKIPLPTYCFEKNIYPIPKKISQNNIFNEQKPSSWYYIQQWKQSANLPKHKMQKQKIIVFADSAGFADYIIPGLTGNELIVVRQGEKYAKTGDEEFSINPAFPEDYRTLFNELKNIGFVPGIIIHLFSVSSPEYNCDYKEIISRQNLGFVSLVNIAKEFSTISAENLQITAVVNNLSDITGAEAISPVQSSILSAVKVIPQEYSGIKAHCIEFDINDLLQREEYYSEKIFDEIVGYSKNKKEEQHVAYRNKKRWTQSYDHHQVESNLSGSRFKEKGIYIITGGAGNVGNVISQFLAQNYQARLIIIGKTKLPEGISRNTSNKNLSDYQNKIIGNLLKCKEKGSEVKYFSLDVADLDSMDEVFQYTIKKYGRIDGVIHTAAATKDKSISAPLNETTINELQNQYDVKVKGAVVISELLKKFEAGFVIIASSTSSILGGIGFGCYSASNTFVNSFVKEQNRQGETEWISLIWDGWYFPEYSETMKEAPRVSTFKPEDGTKILSEINSASEIDHLVISKRNINVEIKNWFVNIYKEKNDQPKENPAAVKERPFLAASYKEPVTIAQKKLCKIWEEFFGIRGIGIEDHFYELGGDSLKATSVISIIHKRTGIRVPLTEFMKKPTIAGLSLFIEKSKVEKYYEIKKVQAGKSYPLSSAQKRLYMLYHMEKDSLAYNVHSSALLEGKLDLSRLKNSFVELINRHESLRTIFKLENGDPVQKIVEPNEIKFEIESVENDEKFFRPFNLERAPLIRAGIKKLDNNKYVLLIDTHHIISDAISMSIIFKELSALYDGVKLPEMQVQYKDYSVWQKESLNQEFIKKQKHYWKENLSGELPVLNLPYDFKRPSVQKYEGEVFAQEIENSLLEPLKKIAKKNEATLFMVLLSAFNILLSKYSGQEDIVVGTPSAGRKNDELKNVIGMFANTLALRNRPVEKLKFSEFLKSVKENSIKAFENQDYQFEELVEDLKVERDVSRNPIFDAMFVYINIDFSSNGMKDVKILPYKLENKISRFDLTLHCSEEKEKIALTFEYSSHLFRKETIERMSKHFKLVIKNIVDNPDELLKDYSIIDNDEIELLANYNDTYKTFAEEYLTVNHLYEKQLKNNFDKPGIIFDDDKKAVTYSEFDKNVNILTAKILSAAGNKCSGLIGVIAERNELMIYGVSAILKSGNGYVPVDPYVPEERAKYIIEDSGCSVLLCQQKFKEFASNIFTGKIVVIEETLEAGIQNEKIIYPTVKETDPLFLLYTSGSTGRPKGVLMPHKPIMNLLLWMREEYPVENERILFLNPYTFDMSIWGLYAWAVNGSSVMVLKHGDEKDPYKIVKAVMERSVTSIHFVPSMLAVFLEYIEKNSVDISSTALRYIFVSGEVLSKHLIGKFNKCFTGTKAELINFYGPTETHVVTHFRTKELDEKSHLVVPIGKPISNTSVLVVDKEMKVVPQGIVGELLLGGDCLADGYLNKAGITNEKFITIKNMLTGKDEKFYKTGDLGRWLSDGNIEFLGRNDFQIKIRGFRVEPDEVQAIINKIKGVKESLVVVKEIAPGDKRLIAYVVYSDEKTIDENYIRKELKKQAADYMVPSAIILLDKFPLNPNGKIDRKKLPEPNFSKERTDIVTPRNKMEKRIAEIWRNVLKIENISIHDNFFDLGGHSLLIINVHNELEKETEGKIEVVDLFRYPTIASLSEFIAGGENNITGKAAQRADKQKAARRRRLNNLRRGERDE